MRYISEVISAHCYFGIMLFRDYVISVFCYFGALLFRYFVIMLFYFGVSVLCYFNFWLMLLVPLQLG